MTGSALGRNTELVLAACAVFGAVAGVVGTFTLARRRSLLADAAGHSTLPGVCIAFLIGERIGLGGRHPVLLLAGGAVSALLAAWSVPALARLRGVGPDGAVAVVLSFFFGLGAVLLSAVQGHESGAQGGINHLLFGSAAAMTRRDLIALVVLACIVIVVIAVFFKELAALAFDEQHARVLGMPVRALDLILLAVLVATVVAGMQVAGIVLVVAMLVTPAAAARAFRGSIARTAMLAAVFGVASSTAGVLASRSIDGLPTGSAMTIAAALLFIAATLGSRRAPTEAAA
jgi:manganese/zinc/iron transport system permease protein